MNRGDIYWIDLNPTVGSEINKLRPCVLVGATPINQARRTVLVVPLSTAVKPRPPIIVEISCLDRKVVAVCDQMRSVDKTRFKNQAGHLSIRDLEKLDSALQQVLCL